MTKESGQGFSRRVTLETIEQFKPLLRRMGGSSPSEDDTQIEKALARQKAADPALLEVEKFFQGQRLKYKIPFTRQHSGRRPGKKAKAREEIAPGHKRKSAEKPAPAAAHSTSISTIWRDFKAFRESRVPAAVHSASTSTAKGKLLWEKKLPASDVQRSPGGNVIGGVKLTQARFKDEGELIDPKTYFRHKVFGEFDWMERRKIPFVEQALVSFQVSILGTSLGIHRLAISHKPSGEAGQSNYTTKLHWGDLSHTIREANLTGRTLQLYEPLSGSHEPFFIEIL